MSTVDPTITNGGGCFRRVVAFSFLVVGGLVLRGRTCGRTCGSTRRGNWARGGGVPARTVPVGGQQFQVDAFGRELMSFQVNVEKIRVHTVHRVPRGSEFAVELEGEPLGLRHFDVDLKRVPGIEHVMGVGVDEDRVVGVAREKSFPRLKVPQQDGCVPCNVVKRIAIGFAGDIGFDVVLQRKCTDTTFKAISFGRVVAQKDEHVFDGFLFVRGSVSFAGIAPLLNCQRVQTGECCYNVVLFFFLGGFAFGFGDFFLRWSFFDLLLLFLRDLLFLFFGQERFGLVKNLDPHTTLFFVLHHQNMKRWCSGQRGVGTGF